MNYTIFDIEATGLLDPQNVEEKVDKIHCLSYKKYHEGVITKGSLISYAEIAKFISEQEIIIAHNGIRYDKPVLEFILGVKITCRIIDTLAISWYLEPQRKVHGLEAWGEILGFPKPSVYDWRNEPVEVYVNRCESDVEINDRLFTRQLNYLKLIYAENGDIDQLFHYLTFKMECAAEQERVRWKLDEQKCREFLETLLRERDIKFNALRDKMPLVPKYAKTEPPKKPFKKDGSLSATGENWKRMTMERGLPFIHDQPLKREIGREIGNPGSPEQLKQWLFSLGWIPETIKQVPIKDKFGNVTGQRSVPQITKDDDSGEICDSIPKLYEIEPALKNLESLSMIKHRVGILQGFLRDVSNDGYLKAEINGFTNTMRFKHSVIVNLPKVSKPYGEMARGCLTCPEGYVLCGSDMASLEDTTKQHYMYFFDPEYVKEMRTPGFDPHIDISVLAGLITKDDEIFYKRIEREQKEAKKEKRVFQFAEGEKARYDAIKLVRGNKGKKVNFSAVYGAGAAKISASSGMPLSESKVLHTIYWVRNKAVKKVAAAAKVITVEGQMWLFNPVSQFWYTLRFDKDRFSTLNQSTGVYCFDLYVRQIRSRGIEICGQFHDEVAIPLPIGYEDRLSFHLNNCIQEVNDIVKLNVPLGISIDFGKYYADIH